MCEEEPSVAGNDFPEHENSLVKWKTGLSGEKVLGCVQLKSDSSVVVAAWAQFLNEEQERKHWTEEMKVRVPERDFNTAVTLQKLRITEDGFLDPFKTKTHYFQL